MQHILAAVSNFVINVISSSGYVGIGLLMAIESSAVPLPSEIIMPFSGYLVATGTFSLLGISMAGAIGSVFGSLFLYSIGYFGGRKVIEKYGKYLFISPADLANAESFFAKYRKSANFTSRILPILRTYISLSAGIAKAEIKSFVIYCFLGSFVWSLFLGWIGYKLGKNWDTLHNYFKNFDLIIVGLIVLAGIWYIGRHIRSKRID